MRLIQFTPGAGGHFYCENCLRDDALAHALRAAGHDVVLVPMYLPLLADESGMPSADRVFFGGINAWLQQKVSVFRHTPRWVDRWLDRPGLLRWIARRARMTDAATHGAMTHSMLCGEAGHQAKELQRLVAWLRHEPPIDAVIFSNALLLGLAPALRAALGVPAVCLLQDEDTWLDAMPPRWREACWSAMNDRVDDVARFIAVSHTYAQFMAGRLPAAAARMRVVYPGVDAGGPAREAEPPTPVLGYLSRRCAGLGLDRVVDAFLALRASGRWPELRLDAAGGETADDREFMQAQRRRVAAAGAGAWVTWRPHLGRVARQAFLRSLTVLAFPVETGVAFGYPLLEAFAAGVPAVGPDAGACAELVGAAGGGVLYLPGGGSEALRAALAALLDDAPRRRALGVAGVAAARTRFSASRMAEDVVTLLNEVRHGHGNAAG